MSDAHTAEERAAAAWWRKQHPEHACTRLQVVRYGGTVFSCMVAPRDPAMPWRQRLYDRVVASLDEVVDAYRAARAEGRA